MEIRVNQRIARRLAGSSRGFSTRSEHAGCWRRREREGREDAGKKWAWRLNRWPWQAESFKRAEWSMFRGPSESRSHGRPNCIQTLPIKLARACISASPRSCASRARSNSLLHLVSYPTAPRRDTLDPSMALQPPLVLPAREREAKSGSLRIRGISFFGVRKSTGRTAARFARHARACLSAFARKFTPPRADRWRESVCNYHSLTLSGRLLSACNAALCRSSSFFFSSVYLLSVSRSAG